MSWFEEMFRIGCVPGTEPIVQVGSGKGKAQAKERSAEGMSDITNSKHIHRLFSKEQAVLKLITT